MVTFKDYYSILGLTRDATPEQIKKAFRGKAKKLHPDVNQGADAEARFREVNEAYEVLSDPEKRARYDRLGGNWQDGAEFKPPPGFEFRSFDGDLSELFGARTRSGGGGSGFSDFFESLFGDLGLGAAQQRSRQGRRRRPADSSAEIELPLADLIAGGTRRLTLTLPAAQGPETKTVSVNIPQGLKPGQRLRLAGVAAGGADLYLTVRLKPEAGIGLQGDDISIEAAVPAPIAVLGGVIRPESPVGPIGLKVPAGTQSGTVLRVRGRGMPRGDGSRGDLMVSVRITIPEHPSAEQRRHYEQLAALDQQAREGGAE